MLEYPVDLQPDPEGGFVVTLPDIPGAVTEGADRAEALAQARQCARAMLSALVEDREPIPLPGPPDGRPSVRLPALDELKIQLYLAMRADGVSQAELGRRLGRDRKEVFRLLDLTYVSKLPQIEEALAALGREARVDVVPTAAPVEDVEPAANAAA